MEWSNKMPTTTKTCPVWGSVDYLFRGRKKIAAEPSKGLGESIETKYRCKACEEEWRVRTQTHGSV